MQIQPEIDQDWPEFFLFLILNMLMVLKFLLLSEFLAFFLRVHILVTRLQTLKVAPQKFSLVTIFT